MSGARNGVQVQVWKLAGVLGVWRWAFGVLLVADAQKGHRVVATLKQRLSL